MFKLIRNGVIIIIIIIVVIIISIIIITIIILPLSSLSSSPSLKVLLSLSFRVLGVELVPKCLKCSLATNRGHYPEVCWTIIVMYPWEYRSSAIDPGVSVHDTRADPPVLAGKLYSLRWMFTRISLTSYWPILSFFHRSYIDHALLYCILSTTFIKLG